MYYYSSLLITQFPMYFKQQHTNIVTLKPLRWHVYFKSFCGLELWAKFIQDFLFAFFSLHLYTTCCTKVYKVHTSVEPQKRLVEHFLITITFIFFLHMTYSKMNENYWLVFLCHIVNSKSEDIFIIMFIFSNL